MARNYDEYGYEEGYKTKGISISKKILIILMIIVSILLILYLIKSCTNNENKVIPNNTPSSIPTTKQTEVPTTKPSTKPTEVPKKEESFDYEKELLKAGKEYYKIHSDELPKKTNECSVIELQYLIEEKLVDSSKFGSCNVNTTYVEACRLKNKKIEYDTWLTCINKKSADDYK